MSVDFTTRFGYGWVVDYDLYCEMTEYAEERGYGAHIEDYFMPINCYKENSEVFIGIRFGSVSEGSFRYCSTLMDILETQKTVWEAELRNVIEVACGRQYEEGSAWEHPDLIVMNCIS